MRYLRVVPFFVVLVVLLMAGLRPDPVPQAFDQQDKLHHLLGFAAFAFSLRLAFPRWGFVWMMGFAMAVALLIELGQGLLPQRTASGWDMLANMLGVLVGWLCWVVVQRIAAQRGSFRPSGRALIDADS
ncbi:VanZ family protein [Stutzerimonas tarimensis]|uniref:VanZ family protein n=1 Tax=Stutzerimonas tarimensis TaxID=1507735 RepID=A0ABV7T6T2_9GAMM